MVIASKVEVQSRVSDVFGLRSVSADSKHPRRCRKCSAPYRPDVLDFTQRWSWHGTEN